VSKKQSVEEKVVDLMESDAMRDCQKVRSPEFKP